jgi:DNA-directed RNA polymerase subunit H
MATQSAKYNPLISKLFISRTVILDILKNYRGFDVGDYEGMGSHELQAMCKNKQMDMLITNVETGRKIFIKYHLEPPKLKQNHIYEYVEDLFDMEQILDSDDELLIITNDKINDTLRELLSNIYKNDNKFVSVLNLNDYLFNILAHEMVPPHRVLFQDEKDIIYKKYYITSDKELPEISRFDPVALAMGIRPGELVEITRSSPTAITTKYYRLCK